MSQSHEAPNYNLIFLYLLVLTILEVGITYMPVPHGLMVFSLVAMAVTKAVLVAMYFMHLKFEARTLGIIALTPAILLIWFVLITYPDTAWRAIGWAIAG